MFDPWSLLASLIFSMVGFVYFRQGRAAGDTVRLVCGIALMAYPYFVPGTLLVVLVGALLTAAPFILERF
ncbi:MAG TPA: hypothetical protein DCW72_08140 [Elusimicrobia bacterium]|nr:MAG: hypothetical protein A2X29_07380 [Elusimicrobia bacterium GWA2_64_40]OGR64782.1 MAG: hypothetical protein A2X30_00650 [Elusimicrobia bacterium GWB2_63_16]HAN05989.1 hypothetical protein [Elusimicrobiota bacterium]HAU90175.1 hypothetical protein [Elusimicrobiota bacterium]